ncbi:MAG: hypothetical protein C4523_13250 [Myxococcales bacterium]|nr:MAG: hypothetical protein C4523_13250 [Myxococcales bacterium]
MKTKALLVWLLVLVMASLAGCASSSEEGLLDGDVDGDGVEPMAYVVVSGGVAVKVGETLTLEAQTVNGEDSGYEWAVDDEAIATVDETGAVAGVAPGSAVVTATGVDSGKTGSWGVYVYTEPAPAGKVRVSGEVALMVGATTTLTATTVDGTDSGYAWSSSNAAIATVDAASGLVTGVSAGEVAITATGADTSESGVWGMYIYEPPVAAPVVAVSGGTSVLVGATLQLSAATEGGTDAGYAWSSSNDAIATVDAATGLVTGVAEGEATITATGDDTNVSGSKVIVVLAVGGPDAPFTEAWGGSAHARAEDEAFIHWNEDGAIPTGCAKCHSTPGYLDFLGADGSAAGVVDAEAPIGTVVSCVACHNDVTLTKDSVTFPSGETLAGLGPESRCMECHQGRESKVSVDTAIANAAPETVDTVDADLGFRNVHYYAAAATQLGSEALGGYQYDGKAYDMKFQHVAGFDTCITCHDPHTLKIRLDKCSECHGAMADQEDLKDVRMFGSLLDYDGDGDTTEGIYYELEGLREKLYAAIQTYALDVAGAAIIYDGSSYPYWFIDTNGNGQVDEGEVNSDNRFASWTARLVKASYNYQVSLKDPGAFAHNAKYIIELLYDSIEDLNAALDTPIDLDGVSREDAGHFNGVEEPFRHWDEDGAVEAGCARCHSSEGLEFYLETGVNVEAPTTNGFACATCHQDLTDFSQQHEAASVTFPSGEEVDSGSNTSNLCMTCHQGRASTASMNTALEGKPLDTVDSALRFQNIHYFAAGATRYGAEAMGAYQYDGKTYDGLFAHVGSAVQCADCHSVHAQKVKLETCVTCHEGVAGEEDLREVRMAGSYLDYDGDGNVEEGIWGEIDTLRGMVLTAMQAYATAQPAVDDIAYNGAAYPYWFNGAGQGYSTWTPRLLKAAFNYQFATKDPGAFAHNAKYVIEILFDTLEDLGADVSALHRHDEGHFDATGLPFRDWDESGAVPVACARCHSVEGFSYFAANGTDLTTTAEPAWGFSCETCHEGFSTGSRALEAPVKYIAAVAFPGGATINNDAGDPDNSFLCMACHKGREGKGTIDAAIAANSFGFKNVHYLAAGAILYGSEAGVGYEYTGKTYAGKWNHLGVSAPATCTYCHKAEAEEHSFEVSCAGCHGAITPANVETIRQNRAADYDGDGSNTEPLKDEVATLAEALYAQIRSYALDTLGHAIIYVGDAYPYFFNDNGEDYTSANKYAYFDAKLMKATHNYQISQKEPGAWAHNTAYIVQLLIDSIEDLNGDVSGYTRP